MTADRMGRAEETRRRRICQEKIEEGARKGICLAFSGGIDSSLLLALARKACREAGTLLEAVTFDTVLHPPCDLQTAAQVARELGAEHKVIYVDELRNPALADNPPDRCYICKKGLFEELIRYAKDRGLGTLMEGTNADDLHVYRPGLRAIRELGLTSPLAEAGLTKAQVRSWAAELGISVASRPSAPCLATRLPYGARIDKSLLKRIGQGEEALREMGLKNIRIRVHGETLRLETDVESFGQILGQREEVLKILKKVGPIYLTLDLEGFRSGSMDLPLAERKKEQE